MFPHSGKDQTCLGTFHIVVLTFCFAIKNLSGHFRSTDGLGENTTYVEVGPSGKRIHSKVGDGEWDFRT